MLTKFTRPRFRYVAVAAGGMSRSSRAQIAAEAEIGSRSRGPREFFRCPAVRPAAPPR